VFSHLVQQLGVSRELGFYDIYTIDEPDDLAFILRPVYALLFICPGRVYVQARDEENDGMLDYTGSGPGEPVIWFKQTIGHACGLIGLLHGVSNGGAKQYIQPGSDLDHLLKEALPLKADGRASLLYNSTAFEVAHHSAALKGDTAAPPADDPNEFHFICFV
jgi:ubiquitin carboxyl-terminal hydrolase L3